MFIWDSLNIWKLELGDFSSTIFQLAKIMLFHVTDFRCNWLISATILIRSQTPTRFKWNCPRFGCAKVGPSKRFKWVRTRSEGMRTEGPFSFLYIFTRSFKSFYMSASLRPSSNVESSMRRIKSFDSTHGRFDVWINWIRRIWFGSTQTLNSTGPVEFNFWVDPNQIRRIQLIQTSNLPCAESNA